jgi:hypothetical protein
MRLRAVRTKPAEGDGGIDRRTLVRLGGVGAAVGVGSVLLKPSAAAATTAALQFGAENDAGTNTTGLTSASGTDTLHVSNSAGAPALEVRSSGAGLIASGGADAAVLATTRGAGPAMLAGVADATATATTIEAAQTGLGIGVLAHIDNLTSDARALVASTRGFGQALLAQVANAGSKAAALRAQTSGFGIAVDAASALGIGGRFAGKTAPIQLVPSTLASHPTSGSAGQLFVDRANRLWFCKGGTNWHQLA